MCEVEKTGKPVAGVPEMALRAVILGNVIPILHHVWLTEGLHLARLPKNQPGPSIIPLSL